VRLKNVVGMQEEAKRAFGLETHQEFDFLEQGFQVMGVVSYVFISYLNDYGLPSTIAWTFPRSDAVFRSFWVFTQKPPGGHEYVARRCLFAAQFYGFCYHLPGGQGGSARRRFMIASVLVMFRELVMLWLFIQIAMLVKLCYHSYDAWIIKSGTWAWAK